jgi:FAD/FMN-containing dehydrogenase
VDVWNDVSRRGLLLGSAGAAGIATLLGTGGPAAGAPIATDAGPMAVTPRDSRYLDMVRGLNQRWVGAPEVVYVVRSTAHVVDTVQRAVRAGKRLSVRSGGHCFEDFVYRPEVQVVVDLSEFRGVGYDSERRAFVVEAGARLLDIYETLYRIWGITIPAGVCYTVGAGGHIAGGGMGMLCRRDGLSIDHLYAVEVVTVDANGVARAVVATREESDPNRDLWWAHTGGGGGSFGIVTRYWFRTPGATGDDPRKLLPTPPREVFVAAPAWPWAKMTRAAFTTLVRNYADWHVANSAPGNRYAGLSALMILTHRSNGQLSLIVQADATVSDGQRRIEEFLEAIDRGVDVAVEPQATTLGEFTPMPDLVQPRRLPWLQATRLLGTTDGRLNDPSMRMDYKSTYMRRSFPERQLGVLYSYLTSAEIDNPSVMTQLHSYGGQVNAVPAAATASVHRDSAFKMIWFVQWQDAADEARYVDWLRRFYRDMYADTGGVPVPNAVTDGCYVNYPDIDLSDRQWNRSPVPWHGLYFKDNYARLQRIKARWDPLDVFHHGQSVRLLQQAPAGATVSYDG